ncbi:MAG: response regulator [Bacteroidetes bacterium]|nr:response regulator [Bacteroidota bacterium]MBL7102942.1 response regulator [Bacteroidales bacterium]
MTKPVAIDFKEFDKIPYSKQKAINKQLPLFLLILLLPFLLSAQYKFDNPLVIDINDGLPSNNITTITKDSLGFMWFGTDKGLCRWDGIIAKIFQSNKSDSNSIAGNRIKTKSLLWDESRNKLFIGTENGLSVYDPQTGKFKNYLIDSQNPGKLKASVTSIIKDCQDIIWICTASGFARFLSGTDNFINYFYEGDFERRPEVVKEKINIILDIKQDLDNDSIFWIGTSSGLLKFNKFTENIQCFYYFPSSQNLESNLNVFRTICLHPNGNLYLGTWTSGMVIFNTKIEKFLRTFRPSGVPESKIFFDGTLPPILVKSDHEIWLPTVQGLCIFDTETENITFSKFYKNPAGKKYPLWLNLIDDQNRLWCGSEYGVYIFDPQNQQFDNFFFKPTAEDKSYITWDIFEDEQTGLIFLAEQNADGLHFFDPSTQQFDYLNLPVSDLDEKSINAIYQSSGGIIWIVCQNELFHLSKDRKTLIPVELEFKSNPMFTDMVQDNNGDIWLSSRNFGLQKLNKEKNKLEDVINWSEYFSSDKSVTEFRSLLIDKDNRIWFRIYEKGYGFYSPEKDTLIYFSNQDSSGYVSYNLICYAKGEKNIIWVGIEDSGLGYIDTDFPMQGVQFKYSIKNGLVSNFIHKIALDDKGRLWMLTGAGVEMLDPESGESSVFTSNDGIKTFDTFANRGSYIPGTIQKLTDGRMVIGYRRGLGFFHPDSLVPNKEIPLPYLTSIKIFEQELDSDTSLFNLHQIELIHKQNFLTFEYSAIVLRPNDMLRFYHQLEGVDRDWVETQHRFASYSNLSPGEYIFRVKTENGYNSGTVKPSILSIIIYPPWWKTWWAYGLYILVLGSIIFGFYRYQLKRQLVQREAIQLRKLNTLKSQLYTNITHEFRTPLTVILGMVDEIKSRLKPGDINRFEESLNMIKRSGGNLLHLVSQMLDLSKLESGKMELQSVQADVIPYLQYLTESFQSLADSKGIKLVFYNEIEEVVMDHDPDKLFNIISNLLSNAIKFTPSGGKVIFHVNKSNGSSNVRLVLKIKDTGIGIPVKELPHIFDRFYQVDGSLTRPGEGTGIGLSLTKELVELMKGEIKVKSHPGEGCEFTVSLPVTQNALRQEAGFKDRPATLEIEDKPDVQIPDALALQDSPESLTPDYPLTLIVEDSQDVARYIASCLGKEYKIHFAKDGMEGINKAFEIIPDIIICDVMMPEKDGFEVCSILKQDERTSHIPIIMLTAKATKEDKLKGLTSGADAYLSKPFDKKELLIRIEKIIELRRHLLDKYSSRKHKLKSTLSQDNIEDVFLQKIISAIEKNIDDSHFGTLQVAHAIGMSESQLYRKLKALTGKSTAVFIRTIRLHKARELLTTTSLNVSEIAYETGFTDPAWFSRVFKEEFGVSPNAFRNK